MKPSKALGCIRGKAFIFAIFLLGGFGVLAIFFGDKISSTVMQFLTTIVLLIGGVVKSGDGFFYDGVPAKPEPPTTEGTAP